MIALLAWLLYSIPEEDVVEVAVAAGVGMVLVTALVSARKTFPRAIFSRIALLAIYPLGIAALLVNLAGTDETSLNDVASEQRSPAGAEISLSADDLEFASTRIEISAETAMVHFTNHDAAPHNLSIYESPQATKTLFKGEVAEAGESIDHVVEGLAPGEYYFRCDIHPTMDGTLIADV